jgi:hypothetical protein
MNQKITYHREHNEYLQMDDEGEDQDSYKNEDSIMKNEHTDKTCLI